MNNFTMIAIVGLLLASCSTTPKKPTPLISIDTEECEEVGEGKYRGCIQSYTVQKNCYIMQGGWTEDRTGVVMGFICQLKEDKAPAPKAATPTTLEIVTEE